MSDNLPTKVQSWAPAINTQMEITKEDFVNIAVAREEEKLQKTLRDLNKKIVSLKELSSDTHTRLVKTATAYVEKTVEEMLTKLSEAFSELGMSHEVDVSISHNSLTLEKINYQVSLTLKEDSNTKFTERRSYHSRTGNQTIVMNRSVDTTPLISNMASQYLDLNNQIETTTTEALTYKKKLSELPALERKARAKLAEGILSKSVEGKALLDSIEGLSSMEG